MVNRNHFCMVHHTTVFMFIIPSFYIWSFGPKQSHDRWKWKWDLKFPRRQFYVISHTHDIKKSATVNEWKKREKCIRKHRVDGRMTPNKSYFRCKCVVCHQNCKVHIMHGCVVNMKIASSMNVAIKAFMPIHFLPFCHCGMSEMLLCWPIKNRNGERNIFMLNKYGKMRDLWILRFPWDKYSINCIHTETKDPCMHIKVPRRNIITEI